ncbi:MAG: hypothetical protein DME26_11400 [Verrucomicrobia bacterium]|nr:MAG: hypothetical protein DME26_11400 [Verrucomicrobiota bacterium]
MLSDHQIFKAPLAVNTKATIRIRTPNAFAAELTASEVEVLPLVDGIRRYNTVINDYKQGWCTYYYEFADVPEVEFFCGGVNEKTPRAAALWRQGNLLHFGFEQSASEMNATGRAMLVNSVAYISRFTEDRPIDVTPSVFGAEPVGTTRRRAGYFTDATKFPDYRVEWLTTTFSTVALREFDSRDRAAATAWFQQARPWLHPGPGNRLEVDQEAKSLGVQFDSPEFFSKTILALRDEMTAAKAATLLARYAPEGPGASADADTWAKWWKDNAPYLFYSEMGSARIHPSRQAVTISVSLETVTA